MAAKFAVHHGFQIRVDRESGKFTVDSITGTHDTLADAKKAIDAIALENIDEPALYFNSHWHDDDPGELEDVRLLGPDRGGDRVRIKRGAQEGHGHGRAGEIESVYRDAHLFRDTAEIRAAWARYRALKIEARKMAERADQVLEAIPKIGDEILKKPRRRR